MATFEAKVSKIFDENPRLARNMPIVIRKIFQESEFTFKQRLRKATEADIESALMRLYDILFIDYYFKKLDDRFLYWVSEHYSEQFSEAELEEMRAQSESHLDFYEVQNVIPGKGSYIKSLVTQKDIFLRDVSSSTNLVTWDIILFRCYCYRENYYATGTLTVFRPTDKQFILNRLKQEWSDYRAISRDSEYAAFAKDRWDVFFQIEREVTDRRENRKFYTSYGELQLCEVRFQVQDLQTVLAAIKSCEEFDFIEVKLRKSKKKKKKFHRYQFDWLTLGIEEELVAIETKDIDNGIMLTTSQLDMEGNPLGIDAIGNLYVDQYLCRLETRSLELAEFAVSHFADLFGDALVFKRIVKLKLDTSRKQNQSEGTKQPAQSTNMYPEITKKLGEKYYLDLLEQKIPDLNNMTPREARRDAAAYALLKEWLKGLENMAERDSLEGKEYIPIEKIKKELDIDSL